MVGTPWLSVIGIGDNGFASLTDEARRLIGEAALLVGGQRHLDMIPDVEGKRLAWRSPLGDTLGDLEAHRGQKVVVLASGDPLWFGVGKLLLTVFSDTDLQILPNVSAFSLACARLGWPLDETGLLSLHSKPVSTLRRHVTPGAKLVILSRDGETVHEVAATLMEQGYGKSRLMVFEHLGGANERRIDDTAEAWSTRPVAALNTIAIICHRAIICHGANPAPRSGSSTPGLPDDMFESDGMLTKREVRAATLARLMPMPGQCLWDIGAGSGAVAIEWLRALRFGQAIAIERDGERARRAQGNAERLGTPELQIVEGEAPACLDNLHRPDAVFVGGGITTPGLLDSCWDALSTGGRLVANVVTLEGEQRLLDWQATHGGDLIRIDISRADKIGPYQGWRPSMPVTQYAMVKS